MKYLITIFLLLLQINTALAQAPQGIPYQAVARNSSGNILSNQNIRVRFTIRDSVATGVIKYQETFTPTTNSLGLFNVNVGMGTVVSGTFSGINWGVNAKYMQVEMDPAGGTAYVDMGTTQMMSVPYALHANTSGLPGAVDLPTVVTGPISSVSYTSATSADTITANGGEFILLRGVCIDTLSVPAIDAGIVAPGNSTGAYSVNLGNLLPGKTYYIRAFATNKNGTAYGNVVSFATPAQSIPNVATDTVTNITNVSALVSGSVVNDGGASVTQRGICYDTAANPTIEKSVSPSGTGLGSFSTVISGLLSNTTYHVRTYATNAVGTAYGADRAFSTVLYSVPTVTTDEAIEAAYTSAICGFNTSNDGNLPIIEQGICFSTSHSPTVADIKVLAPTTTLGHFYITLAALTPGTTYHIKAFSTNSIGTGYGTERTFTTGTLTPPTVLTNPIIGITAVGAVSGGAITSNGGAPVFARGVCWSRSGTPTTDSAHTTESTSDSLYNSVISGLQPGITYYVAAYATNSEGTAYGSVVSFTTATVGGTATLPIVGTKPPATSSTTVTAGGFVSDGGSEITQKGVCWSTSHNPTIADAHTSDGTGLGYFNSTLTLSGCGIVYYVRAYATNSFGTAYGNEYTVSSGFSPTLSPGSVSSVTPTSITFTYNVVSDGGCPLTNNYAYYNVISSTGGLSSGGIDLPFSIGSHSVTFTSLTPNVTYRIQAYGGNSVGFGSTDMHIITTGIPVSGHYIGQNFAGGIIFYLDSSGEHGLVCAPTDQALASWGSSSINVPGTSPDLGTGYNNTTYIVSAHPPSIDESYLAASNCVNLSVGGYTDWYLPSKDELQLMMNNLANVGIGSFNYNTAYEYNSEGYWSSSQISGCCAWAGSASGGLVSSEKYRNRRVRAVRSF